MVQLPLQHDSPMEIAQPTVKDWKKRECELIPGKTEPNYIAIERDYPNLHARFTALGPLMEKVGNGGKGIAWDTKTEVHHLKALNGMLLHRRLYDPRIRAKLTFADTGILTIFVSLQHLDVHEMTKFMSWAFGIFTFDGRAASYIADANILFKLHIFLGLTIFLLFPFTRLLHTLSAPVRYLWRPGCQIVRTRKRGA